MNFKEIINQIESSKEFKEYKEQNNDGFLSDIFTIIKEKEKFNWQLDYYSKRKDRITSFVNQDEEILKREAEIFRKDKSEIIKLNINNIKIPVEKALEDINKKTKEKPMEIIIVLQVIDKKETWNITYLTSSFKTLNTKIDAKSGKIISQEEASLLSSLRLGDFMKKK